MCVSACVFVCDCVLMLGFKKPRFIWRSQFSFTAAASWLWDLTVLFSWLKSGSFHKSSKTRRMPWSSHGKSQSHLHFRPQPECSEYYGKGCAQTHNGTALKNHNGLRWYENKSGSTVWRQDQTPTHFTAPFRKVTETVIFSSLSVFVS